MSSQQSRHHRRQRPAGTDRPRRTRHHRPAAIRQGPCVLATLRRASPASPFSPARCRTPHFAVELNFRQHLRLQGSRRRRILSASAVGSLKEEYRPLDIVIAGPVLRSHGLPSARSSAAAWSHTWAPRIPCAMTWQRSQRLLRSRWGRPSIVAAPPSAWKVLISHPGRVATVSAVGMDVVA